MFRGSVLALLLLSLVSFKTMGCATANCPLPFPFCGGDFPLNTEQTTQFGPAWVDVVMAPTEWVTCFGPYALCYYANCVPSPGSNGTVVDCPCFEWFGTNFILMDSILNLDLYQQTLAFCNSNPGVCNQPNTAPVCKAIIEGTFMNGAHRISTFGFYRAKEEPIGSTDCTNQPGLYGGCMTAPCFDPTIIGPDPKTLLFNCQCPTFDGPFQVGRSNLPCDISPMVYSAAFNPNTPPSNPCDMVDGCVPDAPVENCGCGLFVPGETVLPPDSGVDCTKVCDEYDACVRFDKVQLGFTCDATICTSDTHELVFDACFGLQNCDLTEVFKAEKAAQCSCCASQLCNCQPNVITNKRIGELNEVQRQNGETPQCDINNTLCGT